jgi:hypothetical protein
MCVEMFDLQPLEPPHEPSRFEPVSQVPDFLVQPRAAEPARRGDRVEGSNRSKHQKDERGEQKPDSAFI